MKELINISFVVLALAACNALAPPTPKTENATATIAPTKETATATPASFECQTAFEQRELKEPYQRTKPNSQSRYTLATDELSNYLNLMGIQSLCIPGELGAPFLSYDLGAFNPAEVNGLIQKFQNGEYPADRVAYVELMDFLVNSLQCKQTP